MSITIIIINDGRLSLLKKPGKILNNQNNDYDEQAIHSHRKIF